MTNKPVASRLHPTLLRLAQDRSANVSMIFGFSLLALCGAIGGAVDFARYHNAKSKVQMTMDSASLAGGRAYQIASSNDTTIAVQTAMDYFSKMKPASIGGSTPAFSVIENGTVIRGVVEFDTSAPFLSLFGLPQLHGHIVSESVIAAGGNAGTSLELSLMLDTTGSMAGQKILDLKAAAKDLIDIVVWNDQSQYFSKVALAPFGARINVGTYIDKVSDVQAERTFWGTPRMGISCVTERTGPNAFTDEKPNNGTDMMHAHQGDVGNAARDNVNNYSSTGECTSSGGTLLPEIMPLSSDKVALKARIDSLPATGSTAGSLGTAWAWYLLSPKWTGIWQGASMPRPYSELTELGPKGLPKVMKVAILMTDGIYNTKHGINYGDASAMATTISNNAVSICNNMKAQGIKVYTIGFQLGGSALAEDTLKQCASREANDPVDDPSYFFNAESGDELRAAFRQIALQLSTIRLRS